MKYLSVDKSLRTGVKTIDDQHRVFFRQINSFSRHCARSGASRDRAIRLFTFLRLYSVQHFGLEQALMAEYRYPGLAGHRAAHDGFRAYVDKTLTNLPTLELTASFDLQVNYFLVDWFTRHIRQIDLEMTYFLRETAGKHSNHPLIDFIKGLLPNSR
jgi:hemerythrin